MAGDWFSIDHELPETAQVRGIFERTDAELDQIVGRLYFLWRLADSQTTDGRLEHTGPKTLARLCGGDETFWLAVEEVGWIAFKGEATVVPDFAKRFGASAKRRQLDARRKKLTRTGCGQLADNLRTGCGRGADDPQTQQSQSQSQEEETSKKSPCRPAVDRVVEHYRTYHPKALPNVKSTSKEYRRIRDRLNEGYTVEQLCEAIDGCHKTPHNLGENDRGQKYLGLELIVRTASHVDRFIENNTNPPGSQEENVQYDK